LPGIARSYLSTDADRQVAARAVRKIRPGPSYRTDEELARAAGEIGTTIFHPVGTCKMGPASDPVAVVDARLRCHRVPGCASSMRR